MKKIIKRFLIQSILLLLLLLGLNLQAQVPTGHNLDFSTGGYINWTAKVGKVPAADGEVQFPTTNCPAQNPNNPFNTGCWTTVTPETVSDNSGRFFIVNSSGTDSYSAGQLPKVPAGFTHSSQINNSGGSYHCSQLEYTMEVILENSLLTFMYAMVLESPSHEGLPRFEIDVMKHDPINNAMLDELVDPCAFFVEEGTTNLVATNPEVWHNTSPFYGVWSEWQQIKINLARFVGDRVTIRVRISD